MAYAAVTCLRTTILRLLNSPRISVISPTRDILEFVFKELGWLQELLDRSDGSSWNAMDGEIRDAAEKLEDLLERHELKQFDSKSLSYGDDELMHAITSSMETVKNIKQKYNGELYNSLPEEEEKEEDDEEEEGADELSKGFNKIKRHLVENRTYLFSIVGMAGIGKSALAETIFQDPLILKTFECRVFISIGHNYELEKMKQDILAQINPNNFKLPVEKDEYLKQYLDEKRYLIWLDDVWNSNFWYDYFIDRRRDKVKGSCILLTTRLEDLALNFKGNYFYFLMPFLGKEKSWDLLHEKVFADKVCDVCPPELKSVGKVIAEKCDGLPLMIVTVADILSKSEKTQEYWMDAAHRKSVVFQNAYDQILQVLYPSYYNLDAQVKACFLYMAAFPPNKEVRRSKLANLWCSEGFLEVPLLSVASLCFDQLNLHHVVVSANKLSSDGQRYQACSLHSAFRHLCNKELESNEFLHVIESCGDASTYREPSMRRFSIYHNVLLSVKDVCTSIEYSSPSARSLLCTGAYHKYEVWLPVNIKERMLRVCDVLTIRFFKFPSELLELVQLRYLAITCHENLPTCISQLWKLECLIVHQHVRIISTVEESYVPVEVWELQELAHLQVMGRNLPNPPHGVKLEKLAKLLDVGTYTCTEGVLTNIPNLQKLRVQIELPPDSASAEPALRNLDHISQLTGMLSLQYVTVNHVIISKIVAPPSLSVYPSSVSKLTLSGLGYPWEYLNKILKVLPCLQVLKLLWCAFCGEKWEVEEKGFSNLRCLSIENSDLERWNVRDEYFPNLSNVTLKYCYKLREFPVLSSLKYITIVDCSSEAVTRALKIIDICSVTTSTSWDSSGDARASQDDIYVIYDTAG